MEEYLKVLLEQIRSKKARDLVCEEIKNHITDQIDDNIQHGMNEEEAITAAVKEMGDPVEAGIALDRVHRPQTAWSLIVLMGIISLLSVILQSVIAVNNSELGDNYLMKHAVHVVLGFVMMIIVYRLDYSLMAKYAKIIAVFFLCFLFLKVFIFGIVINGVVSQISIAGYFNVSLIYIMYLYIPIYGAILYQFHGEGMKGIVKALIWMIIPCYIASRIPSLSLSLELFFMMSIILTMAVYKKWFLVHVKRFIFKFWSSIVILPIIFIFFGVKFGWFAEYQIDRIRAFYGGKFNEQVNDQSYLSQTISSFLRSSKLLGSSGKEVAGYLPSYNSDYIISFISTYYGLIVAMLVVTVLLYIVYKIFTIALKQKNQLGMLMGSACGLVFMTMTCFNMIEMVGILPLTRTSLPFFSYGGTEMVVCYILIGIVLSVYRYQSILPARFKKAKLNKVVLVNNK